ncbi:MAG: SoxR reducing system RseC family protein [Bacteroidota bacterium]|nr:SoxR reducing system RseC family protein [Bacteroidota bacterium]
MSKDIEHMGRIAGITGNRVMVNFISQSACASCQAKGVCSVSEVQEKSIEADNPGFELNVGDQVKIILQQSMGFKALFLAYVFPLILILFFLIVLSGILNNEGIAGILSLGGIAAYYGVLFLMRKKVDKQFSFVLKKID